MKITHSNSQEIAERIGAILSRHVNLMDETGTIVASTDETRIGMLHTGARQLIEKNDPEVDIYPEEALSGARNGINVPIHIEGQTIGVVGVTGNPDELRDIALVISEMATILFMSTQQSLKRENLARRRRLFCEDLLLNSHRLDRGDMEQRAKELGFPLALVQTVAVFQIPDHISEKKRLAVDDRLTGLLRTALGDTVYIHHHHIGQNLAVFFHFSPKSKAIAHISRILEQLSGERQLSLYCGLCTNIPSVAFLSRAYSQAERAASIACAQKGERCLIYENLALEIILSQLPPSCIRSFLDNVWKAADSPRISQASGFLRAYFDSEGSLEETAEKLYIHKNTVQYRIKKVTELTGYDPRKLSDSVILFIACRLLQDVYQ